MRKTTEVVIDADNRDKGKIFVITEWPAYKAENWGQRALISVARAGATLAPEARSGMAGVVAIGGIGSMLMYIDSTEVVGLLDELMDCVKIKPAKDKDFTRDLVEDDTEEVGTRLLLKQEVFLLHTGFTLAEIKQKLTSALKAAISLITPTSQEPLGS